MHVSVTVSRIIPADSAEVTDLLKACRSISEIAPTLLQPYGAVGYPSCSFVRAAGAACTSASRNVVCIPLRCYGTLRAYSRAAALVYELGPSALHSRQLTSFSSNSQTSSQCGSRGDWRVVNHCYSEDAQQHGTKPGKLSSSRQTQEQLQHIVRIASHYHSSSRTPKPMHTWGYLAEQLGTA